MTTDPPRPPTAAPASGDASSPAADASPAAADASPAAADASSPAADAASPAADAAPLAAGSSPRPPAALRFWRGLLSRYLRLLTRVRREGPEPFPAAGPVIVAANHHCSLDPFLLIVTTPPERMPAFLIAREFAEWPLFSRLVRLAGGIPVNRTGLDTAATRAALRHLRRGGVLGIFPQGGIRPPDEDPVPHDGVGLLALQGPAAVIPAFISGTYASPRVLAPWFRRQRAVVRYGPPVDLTRWRDRARDRRAAAEAAGEIMRAVAALRPASADAPPGGKGRDNAAAPR